MKLFGLDIRRKSFLLTRPSSWMGPVLESFPGAWQRNIVVDAPQNITAFSAVFSCISLIESDISKLRIKLCEDEGGIWEEITSGSPFLPVLRKPNRYQTRIQFLSQWITSKLLHGNAYIYKDRDQRGIVTALYVLDPRLVTPSVAPDGAVYYSLSQDYLSGIDEAVGIVPASAIIHDRMITLWHPLVGVTPIYACGASATQGTRIQNNSAKFFENMSRPSGHLTAPGTLSTETVARLKQMFETNFGGANIGRLLVTGDGLKYEPMTIPANDAQLIEQLKWTVEDVARCFHVPLHKLGIGQPTLNNIGALNQDYYTQTLQTHIEAIEILLDEGLSLPTGMGTELDLDGLLRMDPQARAATNEIEIRSATLTPDEGRFKENRGPVVGGDTPYMQQQNYSLAALAKRDAKADPFATNTPDKPASVAANDDVAGAGAQARALIETIQKGLEYAAV